MKDLLINGTRFLTTDEIADATLEYASALSQSRGVDTIRFPAIVGGTAAQTAVVVGIGAHVVVIDAPDVIPVRLRGAGEAAEAIVVSTRTTTIRCPETRRRAVRLGPWAGSSTTRSAIRSTSTTARSRTCGSSS